MEDITINGYVLRMTCGACPEQYDAYFNNDYVGYFRLRYGNFYVESVKDETIVYYTYPKGDGVFEEDERMIELTKGIEFLHEHLKTYNNRITK